MRVSTQFHDDSVAAMGYLPIHNTIRSPGAALGEDA
jgi:hypothetical protein